MKIYNLWASQQVYLETQVEAESLEKAWEIALATGDWEEYDGEHIIPCEGVEVAHG
jgi:hypothetical protein